MWSPVIDTASNRDSSWSNTLGSAIAVLRVPVWIGVFCALLTTTADPDLWGHVRFGLDMLSTGRLTTVDPYSYTSDIPWLNHEWLSELIMGTAYRAFGSGGLVALKIALALATLALMAPVFRGASENWRWPAAFLVVGGLGPLALTVRPQLWTMLFVVALCRILNAAPVYRWSLPLIFALWVNLHGGWIIGAGILVLWSMLELVGVASGRPSRWISLGVPALCAASTLANPYGVKAWVFIATTVRLSRPGIIEWEPLWMQPAGAFVSWLLTLGWAAFAVRRARVVRPEAIAIVVCFAFASLRVVRLLPLFVPVSIVLLLPYVHPLTLTSERVWPKGRTLVDVAFICVGVLVFAWPGSATCIQLQGSWQPDIAAARALAVAHPSGRLATSFNWGQYAIWHFGSLTRVSIDGRRETVYSDQQLQRQLAVALGENAGLEELARTLPEYVWLPTAPSERTRRWLMAHQYRIDIQTPQSFVAVRRDLPRIEPVRRVMAPCFPGLQTPMAYSSN
jgi:hypothetical protein